MKSVAVGLLLLGLLLATTSAIPSRPTKIDEAPLASDAPHQAPVTRNRYRRQTPGDPSVPLEAPVTTLRPLLQPTEAPVIEEATTIITDSETVPPTESPQTEQTVQVNEEPVTETEAPPTSPATTQSATTTTTESVPETTPTPDPTTKAPTTTTADPTTLPPTTTTTTPDPTTTSSTTTASIPTSTQPVATELVESSTSVTLKPIPKPTAAPKPPGGSPWDAGAGPARRPLLIPSSETIEDDSQDSEMCDFGTNEEVSLCNWMNVNVTSLKWRASRGENAYWMGGPVEDVTYGDIYGGYAVFETSERPDLTRGVAAFESAMLISPLRPSTGAAGVCIKYWYSIGGLSADRVRVLLHPMPNAKFKTEDPNTNTVNVDSTNSDANTDNANCKPDPSDSNYDQMLNMLSGYDGSDDVVLWEARDVTQGDWKEGQIVYTYNMPHAIIVEGIPVSSSDINRRFRGFVAIDELDFAESSECGAFCTFEAGTCGWEQDTLLDDFDWTLSRGSLNPSTGPPRDRSSFSNGGMMGGFAMIDSGYPRRPGDRARLMTQEFQATDANSPLCMRFWTHMYGNGIGSLRVLIINTLQDQEEETIWEIKGEAGNLWYQGQVPISSSKPFKIAFEGEVGNNNLGDIALDDISIIQGPCPSAPQVAGNNLGDCTFEVDECNWVSPGNRDRVDEIDWVRTVASENNHPRSDHTIGTPQGFFMTVPKGNVQRGGDRAWLRSAIMDGSSDPMCVSFWYFLYEPFIEPSGPSLGSLTLYLFSEDAQEGTTILRPLWSLRNHQGPNWLYAQAKVQSDTDYAVIFEGTWGHSRGNGFMGLDDITIFMGDCTTMPAKAEITMGDCDFQRDSCSWVNVTTDPDFRWSQATISRRPTSLPDHTFSGPVGYVFFDVFNQNANPQTLRLTSPVLEGKSACISFWYASFGSGSATTLSVQRLQPDGDESTGEEIWKVSSQGGVQPRPEWVFAQAPIDTNNDFKIAFVGEASNGGYAIDDIKIYPDVCKIRPKESDPNYVAPDNPRVTG